MKEKFIAESGIDIDKLETIERKKSSSKLKQEAEQAKRNYQEPTKLL